MTQKSDEELKSEFLATRGPTLCEKADRRPELAPLYYFDNFVHISPGGYQAIRFPRCQ